MKNDDIIENFGELPAEEQTRLVAGQEANEWAAIERMRLENQTKAAQVEELQGLVAERRQLLEKMRRAVAEIEAQDARIARDVERVLAKAA